MLPARPLASLKHLFGFRPALSREEIAAYAPPVLAALDRAEQLYDEWFAQASLLADSERLANVAAIHRWEAATLSQALDKVVPPPALAKVHADLVAALQTASRAAQLLSSGSRFHNASAVCDGQTMLEESRKHRLVAARAVRRAIDSRAPVDSLAPNATQAEAFTPGRSLPLPASARVED